ncbi:phosphotransferase-like protein [Niallia sp.]|uniref:chloramphenicol phosphotransferase CPT family protein n=1 Tax=Niallia sp. TaxID=2837523 RepID=UPI002897246E|nr:chloramphenicol phosphotransferase [Niallia sp.]
MLERDRNGKIIILNGAPRSGKSSIASAIQNLFEGVWMNLGVDQFMSTIPDKYQPGIGLRPGGERPDLEPLILKMYLTLYKTIALYSKAGLHIIVDIGHHNGYSQPLDILPKCARILTEHKVLFVGIHCPIEEIMERRMKTGYAAFTNDGKIPKSILLWQQEVHKPGIYDLEVDTSQRTVEECVNVIRERLKEDLQLEAFKYIAQMNE